ncbi:MAG: hypothetical protein Q8P41_27450 [Pseudomonadota bacterium]|nr:hypothetical protein [Pseudomonadota bacterium]
MILPPRTLAIRLFFWTVLLVYAVWNLRGHDTADVFVPEEVPAAPPVDPRVPLPAPSAVTRLSGDAPPVVDIEAAVAAMDAAVAALAACPVGGTFSVRLDATGLAEAFLLAEAAADGTRATPSAETLACAATAAWAPAWPRTTQGFEMERGIGP